MIHPLLTQVLKRHTKPRLLKVNLRFLPIASFYHARHGTYGYKPDASPRYDPSFKVDPETLQRRIENPNVHRYINAYRHFGHLRANTNPLEVNTSEMAELDPAFYGLNSSDESINAEGLVSGCANTLTMSELTQKLKNTYCSQISAEFMYLPTLEEREWFAKQLEETVDVELSHEERKVLAQDLLRSQTWDHFMAVKFPSVKRYGAEGAESMMAFFRETFRELSKDGAEELVIGMGHRGRLNLLMGLLEFPPELMFSKLKGLPEFPTEVEGMGDVLSHMICSVDLDFGGAKPLHVSMLYNPSHLEAVDPVTCGKARGRQRRLQDGHYAPQDQPPQPNKVACLQVHGDAAVAGQGIVQETLALAEVPNFSIGGSLHMVTNNQVGYTTTAERARSSIYCTDVSKMCLFPVIHVNGDNPEAVAKAARVAVAYNRRFYRDVFLDLVCWRRWGHNELDNPRFTNPHMYKTIDSKMSVPDAYAENLNECGLMTNQESKEVVTSYTATLTQHLKNVDSFQPQAPHLTKHWDSLTEAQEAIEVWDTGVDVALLKYLGAKSVEVPENFALHPTLQKSHVTARLEKMKSGEAIDWATGETLAIASLLHQGYDVRLSGEDVGRGTFSQRHAMLVDQETDELTVPLNELIPDQKSFLEVSNSILSEEAVLGYEYGVSIDSPDILCLWEAQFGDFFNGAQVILDTFLSSGEEKWLIQSGLTLLLPHGYDGAGPEHSSCRVERFLQMSNSREDVPDSERVNWNIVNPTTAAQIFHILRRQMIRNFRKPLIVVGPKAILRAPEAFSTLQDMAPGTHFLPVIGDSGVSPDAVQKVIFVSGKHYYLLKEERKKRNLETEVALVRLEALCPFPTQAINDELAKYKNAKTFIWSQEEQRNMGCWTFVAPRFRNLCGTQLKYAGRKEQGSVAAGVGLFHKQEVEDFLKQTFETS